MKRLYWNIVMKKVDGIGIIEIILILVIIIGLVWIFRKQITGIIQQSFNQINGDASEINSDLNIN